MKLIGRNIIAVATLTIVLAIYGWSMAKASFDTYDLSLRITPSVVDEVMTPGETTTKIFNITNATNTILPITAYVSVFSANDELGGMKFDPVATDQYSPINWIKIKKDKFILQPNQSDMVSVDFMPPKDIAPGGYYAVLFFESVLAQNSQAGAIRVGGQVGSLLFITIPGDITSGGEIIDAKTSPWHVLRTPMPIDIRFSNTGNIHLRPSGAIVLKSYPFLTQSSTPIERFTVLPHTIRETQTIPQIKWPGIYRADIVLQLDGDKAVKYRSIYFLYLSWPWLMATIILICGITVVSSRKRLASFRGAWFALLGRYKKEKITIPEKNNEGFYE